MSDVVVHGLKRDLVAFVCYSSPLLLLLEGVAGGCGHHLHGVGGARVRGRRPGCEIGDLFYHGLCIWSGSHLGVVYCQQGVVITAFIHWSGIVCIGSGRGRDMM